MPRYTKQATEWESQARQVSDQLAGARAAAEQAALQWRAGKRALEYEQSQAAADVAAYKTKVDNLNSALK